MLPGFTATAADYRSPRMYAVARAAPRRSAGAVVVAELFACDDDTCSCFGVDDCTDMFTSGSCSWIASCWPVGDDVTPYCECVPA
jgi:hypothetical protein